MNETSSLIRDALAAVDAPFDAIVTDISEGRVCQGAKFHSPSPIVVHKVQIDDETEVLLCGNCRDNLSALQHLGPAVPWKLRRSFGNVLRGLVNL